MGTARALGAYYTPGRLVEPLCHWAVRKRTDRVLDPSCGEGSFLTRAVDRLGSLGAPPHRLADQIAGVELDAPALARARGALLSRRPGLRWSRLVHDDFIRFAERHAGELSFDAVVGNPPFLRTQGRSAARKRREVRAARRFGAALTGDASSWAAFIAAAAAFVRPGGRLAMIVPREALFVNYTRPLLAMLERRFAGVHLIPVDGLWFEKALVRVAVLLCEGTGPGRVRIHEPSALDAAPETGGPVADAGPDGSWLWTRLERDARAAAVRAFGSAHATTLSEIATLFIGVVTGERDYFLLPRSRARELGLPARFLSPALSRPAQLRGSAFGTADLHALERADAPCRLLTVPAGYRRGHPGLDAYLDHGISAGIPRNYKCRTRNPWFSVRRMLEPADLLLGYLVKRRPRFAVNAARVHTTNNLHRAYLKRPWRRHARLIAAAAFNAATMLSLELTGRVAAGGVLKIELRDASRIRMVSPERLAKAPFPATRARAIDAALRRGRDAEAFALADALAADATGWPARDLERMRRAQIDLRDSRLGPQRHRGTEKNTETSL